ncbi:MAG: hypothetical protein LKE52_02780 [Bacilli bacterium]|nr:hypothetical protein [Bacilli bacterium]
MDKKITMEISKPRTAAKKGDPIFYQGKNQSLKTRLRRKRKTKKKECLQQGRNAFLFHLMQENL